VEEGKSTFLVELRAQLGAFFFGMKLQFTLLTASGLLHTIMLTHSR
jgi:hypothetical protein